MILHRPFLLTFIPNKYGFFFVTHKNKMILFLNESVRKKAKYS